MKINVEKLQSGGEMPLFSAYRPLPDIEEKPSTEVTKPSSTTASSESVLDEYTIKQLTEKGLPNEVNYFINSIQSLYSNPFSKGNYKQTSKKQLQLVKELNRISFNRSQYDEAIKNATKNNALNEVVVNDIGKVLVYDKDGELDTVGLESFDPNSQRMLTVGEYATLRAQDPNLAFNSSSLNLINGSIGRETVLGKVTDYVSKLQADYKYNEVFLSSEKEKDAKVLAQLNATSTDGVYKYSLADEGLSNDKVRKAVGNIYKTLNQKEKTLLGTVALQNGLDVKEGSLQIIFDTISTNTAHKNTQKIDFDAQATTASGGSGGSDAKGLGDTTQAMAMMNGESTVTRPITILSGNTEMTVPNAKWWSTLADLEGKPIIGASLKDVLSNSSMAGIGNPSAVYFGREKISGDKLSKVAFIGENGVSMAFLPYKKTAQGNAIDYEVSDKLNLAREEVSKRGLKLPQDIMSVYKKHSVSQYYKADQDPEFAYKSGLLYPFYLVDGYATENVVNSNVSGGEVIKGKWGFDSKEYASAKQSYIDALTAGDADKWDDLVDNSMTDADIIKGTISIPWSGDQITAGALSKVLQQFKYDYNVDTLTTRGKSLYNRINSPVINNFLNK